MIHDSHCSLNGKTLFRTEIIDPTPLKRKRGRPPGSKNTVPGKRGIDKAESTANNPGYEALLL